MKQVTLVKTDADMAVLVTSDENQNGSLTSFRRTKDEDKQFMIALANFLGYEPSSLLCFDDEEG